jgi:hypothetical protein
MVVDLIARTELNGLKEIGSREPGYTITDAKVVQSNREHALQTQRHMATSGIAQEVSKEL